MLLSLKCKGISVGLLAALFLETILILSREIGLLITSQVPYSWCNMVRHGATYSIPQVRQLFYDSQWMDLRICYLMLFVPGPPGRIPARAKHVAVPRTEFCWLLCSDRSADRCVKDVKATGRTPTHWPQYSFPAYQRLSLWRTPSCSNTI